MPRQAHDNGRAGGPRRLTPPSRHGSGECRPERQKEPFGLGPDQGRGREREQPRRPAGSAGAPGQRPDGGGGQKGEEEIGVAGVERAEQDGTPGGSGGGEDALDGPGRTCDLPPGGGQGDHEHALPSSGGHGRGAAEQDPVGEELRPQGGIARVQGGVGGPGEPGDVEAAGEGERPGLEPPDVAEVPPERGHCGDQGGVGKRQRRSGDRGAAGRRPARYGRTADREAGGQTGGRRVAGSPPASTGSRSPRPRPPWCPRRPCPRGGSRRGEPVGERRRGRDAPPTPPPAPQRPRATRRPSGARGGVEGDGAPMPCQPPSRGGRGADKDDHGIRPAGASGPVSAQRPAQVGALPRGFEEHRRALDGGYRVRQHEDDPGSRGNGRVDERCQGAGPSGLPGRAG